MKNLRTAKLVLCSFALGSIFVAAARPADAILGAGDLVIVAKDLGNIPNWITQVAQMETQINNQVQRYNQEVLELKHVAASLKIADGRGGAAAQFSATAKQFAQNAPSVQAVNLAQSVINGSDGALRSGDLTTLMNDVRGAVGANSSRDAQQEGAATVASTMEQLAVLEASKIAQDQTNYYDALKRQASMMDTLGAPTADFSY